MEKAFNLVKLVGSALVGLGGLVVAILGIKKEVVTKPAITTTEPTTTPETTTPAPEASSEQQ